MLLYVLVTKAIVKLFIINLRYNTPLQGVTMNYGSGKYNYTAVGKNVRRSNKSFFCGSPHRQGSV
ncbi:hypothetical protein LCGC14_1633240 [marine sediment metagenome]|uniref:Uncharacterized protein n=1 Tax=marine sediment metagenome TaxID=412755 RepID=A0A0F9KHL9_9ZZZZ